ncbi:MAG: TrmH family RNA methyltransferase [Treponema sp.]|nr:TrmH family RNA methyltransferase [Treponema sp.]
MISLAKLSSLPGTLKYRKAASLIKNAELRLARAGAIPPNEALYLGQLCELLAREEGLPGAVLKILREAQGSLAAEGAPAREDLLRSLGLIYNLLLARTGKVQADWDFYDRAEKLDPQKRRVFSGMEVYLEDIRSPFNVGAMFRAAESFGAEKIWLSPLSADPLHRRALRSAMGCVEILPWERLDRDPFAPGAAAGPPGFEGPFFTLETGGSPLDSFPFPPRAILIAGTEELGVSPQALAAADASLGRVSIPMYGSKGSLNVSVAFGITMQAWAQALDR